MHDDIFLRILFWGLVGIPGIHRRPGFPTTSPRLLETWSKSPALWWAGAAQKVAPALIPSWFKQKLNFEVGWMGVLLGFISYIFGLPPTQ